MDEIKNKPSPQPPDPWETHVARLAGRLSYPPAPDLRAAVLAQTHPKAPTPRRAGVLAPRRRRFAALAAVIVIAFLAALLLVPPVRAALVEFLQIGPVRIFLATPAPTATPPAPASAGARAPVTATPAAPASREAAALDDLTGETTLAEAEERLGFEIPLPAYPPGLGPPQRVFLQDQNGPVAFLVWLEPGDPARVRLSLHVIGPGSFAVTKFGPDVLQVTEVGGTMALWAEGPYLVEFRGRGLDALRLVDGHVLIWQPDDYTYRLETDLPLEEALKVAESLAVP